MRGVTKHVSFELFCNLVHGLPHPHQRRTPHRRPVLLLGGHWFSRGPSFTGGAIDGQGRTTRGHLMRGAKHQRLRARIGWARAERDEPRRASHDDSKRMYPIAILPPRQTRHPACSLARPALLLFGTHGRRRRCRHFLAHLSQLLLELCFV